MKNKDATQQGAAADANTGDSAKAGAHYSPRRNRMADIIRKHTTGEGAPEEAKTHEDWRAEQAGITPAEPTEPAAQEGEEGDDTGQEPAVPAPAGEPGEGAHGAEEDDGDSGGTPAGEDDNTPDPNEPQPVEYEGLDGLPLYRMPDGEVKVKMRVHGQDVYQPLDRLKASAQKATAGDIALQEAARARQSLEEWEKTLKQREADLASSRQPSSTDAVDEAALAEEAKGLVEELTLGETDEAATKLSQFVTKHVAQAVQAAQASGSTADPAAIVEQARTTVRAEMEEQSRQNEINKGFRKVAERYPDLVSDDRAFKLLDDEAERLEMEHGGDPEWTPSRIMATAADNIAGYLGRAPAGGQPKPADDPAPAGGPSKREARKEGMVPLPRAASAVAQSTRSEPVDRSPKSVVDRMREQRNRLAGRQG